VLPDVAAPAGEAPGAACQRALAHVLSLGDDGDRSETATEARRVLDGWPGPLDRSRWPLPGPGPP
jgi:hypothetical protein